MALNTQTVGDAAKALRESLSILDVLQRMTAVTPRRNGAEWSSSCPKCGDGGKGDLSDRFYVTADGKSCACRKCHTQRMDVAGLVAWLQGVPMHEALDILSGRRNYTPVRSSVTTVINDTLTVETAQDATSPEWRTRAAIAVQRACERLFMQTGGAEKARQYLASRGLTPDTWRAFSLGYDKTSIPDGSKLYAPAISWPVTHEETSETYSVRYRFFEAHAGEDGKEHRYTSKYGSRTSGRLFGAAALPKDADMALRCLVVTEGEFNAMSVWQACHVTGVDVLSFGSESQRTLPAWCVTLAGHYGSVVTWLDDTAKALEVSRQLPQAKALRSVMQDGVKLDANALLQSGRLGALVQAARLSVLRESERQSVTLQLWETRHAIDAGQAHVAKATAQALGLALPDEVSQLSQEAVTPSSSISKWTLTLDEASQETVTPSSGVRLEDFYDRDLTQAEYATAYSMAVAGRVGFACRYAPMGIYRIWLQEA